MKRMIISVLLGVSILGSKSFAQDFGFIWIKSFLPGSANLDDPTIDKRALAFLDSLMQNPKIEVQFLGASDNLRWRQNGKYVKIEISKAWDVAKKLERASKLRSRYNRGEIGVTDEPIRGVKVVWRLKDGHLAALESKIDQVLEEVNKLKVAYKRQFAALQDSLTRLAAAKTKVPSKPIFYDWELKGGVMSWSAGTPWDLSVPYIGLSLKREKWALVLQGGVTPWSKRDPLGNRGDAMILGAINLSPNSWNGLLIGAFSGWEFLTRSDQWTMKVIGITVGPNFRWKFWEIYAGYVISKISSLTEPDQWRSGTMISVSINFK